MKEATISLKGAFPPIPTPFDAEGEVDHQALARNLERWNQYDLAGYVVLGSNGEAAYLTEEEKLQVWETAREAIPSNKLMIAGTGLEPTCQTTFLTRRAAELGADAALVLTPHYYGGKMTRDSLVHHYETVADESPIPIILYNVPKFTHVDMDGATIASASEHANIVGIKDSGGNIAKLADVVRQAHPDFQVLAGSAGFLLGGLSVGAVGGVMALANVAPQECIDIYNLFREGCLGEAAEIQRRMIPVNAGVTGGFGVAGLKAALDMLGYYGGPVRSPLLDLTESDRETLRNILSGGGLL
jgi:4-hydroxy-2-oxoglutarate aldolase